MKSEKTVSISASIILSSVLAVLLAGIAALSSCKDITFNNPLDPNASKEVVKIIQVVETLLSGQGDLAFDGEKIWKTDIYGSLSAVDRESGTIIRTFNTIPATGICFFEDVIYFCNGSGENILYIIDPLSGEELNHVATTDISPGFLAVDNDHLIIYDNRSAGIFRYDPGTGHSERLFDVSGINTGGIAMYGGSLLISDMNTDSLYRFSMSGEVQDVLSSPASGIGGITVDYNNYIYLFMLDGKLYKVSLP